MVFERSDKCMVLAPGPVVRVEGKPGFLGSRVLPVSEKG